MILIADSGSTKTHWCLMAANGHCSEYFTDGINPFQQTSDAIKNSVNNQLLPQIAHLMWAGSISKIFFYGVLTLAPYMFYEGWDITWAAFANPVVVGNLLFLGIVASLICYWSWNMVLEKLGAIKATNYLYLNPIVALITSWIVLNERITPLAMVGTALILLGVYLAESKKKSHKGE